jgi:uncharacterized protein (TIGR02598 family)
MTVRIAAAGPLRPTPAAFTLVEIILALAVIATALVAVIGVLPVGMDSSRQAVSQTAVALILEDLHNRLQKETLQPGPASFSPAYFDVHGVFIGSDATPAELAGRLYRADVAVAKWQTPPANTSALLAATVALSWPVDPASGKPLGASNPRTTVTFGVTELTGPAWQAIDPTFTPKIEF